MACLDRSAGGPAGGAAIATPPNMNAAAAATANRTLFNARPSNPVGILGFNCADRHLILRAHDLHRTATGPGGGATSAPNSPPSAGRSSPNPRARIASRLIGGASHQVRTKL